VAETVREFAALIATSKCLLFGPGTGAGSAMDQLLAELKRHHPELAKRVVGTVPVDENHATESELLARAREF
jgi:hypothetical protein